MLAVPRKNQSKVSSMKALIASKTARGLIRQCERVEHEHDHREPEIMKTGLWISSPNGPIFRWMLS